MLKPVRPIGAMATIPDRATANAAARMRRELRTTAFGPGSAWATGWSPGATGATST